MNLIRSMSKHEVSDGIVCSERADLFVAVDDLAKQVARLRRGLEFIRIFTESGEPSPASEVFQSEATHVPLVPCPNERVAASDLEPKECALADRPNAQMQLSNDGRHCPLTALDVLGTDLAETHDPHEVDKQSSIASRIAELQDRLGGFKG